MKEAIEALEERLAKNRLLPSDRAAYYRAWLEAREIADSALSLLRAEAQTVSDDYGERTAAEAIELLRWRDNFLVESGQRSAFTKWVAERDAPSPPQEERRT